jgi:polar amino acid transport system permease protein
MAANENSTNPRFIPLSEKLAKIPWWLLVAIMLGALIVMAVIADDTYRDIFNFVQTGLIVTVYVTVVAYTLSLIVGLLVGLARVSANTFIYQTATFFVEIIRGIPILTLLYYIALAIIPGIIDSVNLFGVDMVRHGMRAGMITPPDSVLESGGIFQMNAIGEIGRTLVTFRSRDVSETARVIVALSIGYGAFISENFRAGIQSIEPGQMEAARALGMSYWQAMRHVILPQAIRNILPPLGNNFIAMLKDSSLVSVLGVRDITLMGKLYATSTFRFFETYNVVAFLYLIMTIALSLLVQQIEKRLTISRQTSKIK